MNLTETAQLLTMIALVDRRTISELDVKTWHHILEPLSYARCEAAVIDHRRHQPGVWLEPGHIWQRAKTTTDGDADRAGTHRGWALAEGIPVREITRSVPRAIVAKDVRDAPAPEVDEAAAKVIEDERRRQLDALEAMASEPQEQAS